MFIASLALLVSIAAAPSTVYVNATKLHLRKTPSTTAPSLVRLPTNAPLHVLSIEKSAEGEWLRVKIGDGREGFVAASMTSSQQLTLDAATTQAHKAKDAKERVTWLERAAALQSSREVLRDLAVALRASGDVKRAELIEQRVSWPEDVLLVARGDGQRVSIELPVAVQDNNEDGSTLDDRGGRAATAAEVKAWGVVVGEAWWVLPARGAAVRAKVKGARLEILNECGGTWGAVLELELDAAGARDTPIAATRRAEPPASWRTATPVVNELAKAEAAVRAALRDMKGSGEAQVRVASDAGGEVIARAWWIPPERMKDELEFYEQTNRVVSLKIARTKDGTKAGAWKASVVAEQTGSHMNPFYPLARRDIDGDGAFDTFLSDDCSVRVVMDAGTLKYDDPATVVRAQTENRCCGC